MKSWLRTIILIIILSLLYYNKDALISFLKPKIDQIKVGDGVMSVLDKNNDWLGSINVNDQIIDEVYLPGPLRKLANPTSFQENLIYTKIIESTNNERQKNGLPKLSEQKLLNSSATYKSKDMNERQYFEHESPDGKNIEDLVGNFNYEYVTIGENLAMGNFKSEAEIVEAWMNSPGHRANILNSKYTQIGIGLIKGSWQGQDVWFAVQHFGKPLSACPNVDKNLKAIIESNQAQIQKISQTLNDQRSTLEQNKASSKYVDLVNAYNELVGKYNKLIQSNKDLVAQYNRQVQAFNKCIE